MQGISADEVDNESEACREGEETFAAFTRCVLFFFLVSLTQSLLLSFNKLK